MTAESYPPIEDLVPHGLPMRVVEEMLSWQPGSATCRLQLRAHAPFVSDGSVPSVVLLEYLAQTVAACLGYEAYLGGGSIRVGMIVGVRKMQLFRERVFVGEEIRTEVERIRGNEDVSSFRGEASVDGQVVCVAHMTLVHPLVLPGAEPN
jgi:predicted hotdog family 3-hydroxylacyl-ACP dehydratase